ncbi:unnamed protein product [Prorocentrum cordatum]|uniref:Uncharacterized protein n=1 Tax=Prorocentrum cordatum TaxID=2364126 RepID=A0ABN9RG75_9DINO|nr:unnamed protein product [Polarella glacialis]
MLRTKVKYRRHCRALAIQGTLQMQRQNTTSLHGQLEQSKNTFKTIRIVATKNAPWRRQLASEVPWPPVAAVPFSWGDRHGGGSGPAAGRKRERELAWIQAQAMIAPWSVGHQPQKARGWGPVMVDEPRG